MDQKWAKSLVDLPMAVPEYWWCGYRSQKRCHGTIKKGNASAANNSCFLLELFDIPGIIYGMGYPAVLLYCDSDDKNIGKFSLPAQPPVDPAQEPYVTAQPGRAP